MLAVCRRAACSGRYSYILVLLWVAGLMASYTLGGVLHALLVIALAVLLIQFAGGEGPPEITQASQFPAPHPVPVWYDISFIMLRFETAGESHGECLVALLAGLPAGIPISLDAVNRELWRRQQGFGRGGRMKIETDRAEIVSGRAPLAHHRLPGRHPDPQPRLAQLDRSAAGGGFCRSATISASR